MSVDLTTWTLSEIREKVRELSGRISDAQLTNTKLDRYINQFYQHIFPRKVNALRLETRFQLTIDSDGNDGRYSIAPEVAWIIPPVRVDGYEVTLYHDHELFFSRWSRTESWTESRPYEVLFFDRELWFRPPPDQAYTVEVVAVKIPTKLTNTSDQPLESRWGPAIAYGAAIDILTDEGDYDAASMRSMSLKNHIAVINEDRVRQLVGQRACPSF